MKELSLNILDIAHNSVKAEASRIDIIVSESESDNLVCIEISDDGCGMSEQLLNKVTDPFVTSRDTRKVGLGLPLLKQQAEGADGFFEISSELGVGTKVKAGFRLDHLDRVPIGDMASTITALIGAADKIRYVYKHITDVGEFILDTDDIKAEIGDISPAQPEILSWINEFINENLFNIKGGKI